MPAAFYSQGTWIFSSEDMVIYVNKASTSQPSVQVPCAKLVTEYIGPEEQFGNGVVIAYAPRFLACLERVHGLLAREKESPGIAIAMSDIERVLSTFRESLQFIDDTIPDQ